MSIVVRSLLAPSALALATLVAGPSVNSAQAAWKESVRITFNLDEDGSGLGYRPRLGVLLDGSTLYGTTASGGVHNGGVAYRRAGSTKTAIYSFIDGDTTKCGYQPSSGLVKDPSKLVLYGTTYLGGIHNGGVLFSLTPTSDPSKPWTCKVIHSFSKSGSAGYSPFGGLIFGAGGYLYGTTQYNAVKTTNGVKVPTGGVVFRVATTGGSSYKVLHSFSAQSQGLVPAGPVTQGAGGILYGATFFGGSGNAGAIYKLTTGGNSFAVLHSFGKGAIGAKSGYQPTQGPLLVDGTNIYGATTLGGCELDEDKDPQCPNKDSLPGGVLFTLKTSGSGYKVLYTFDAGSPGVAKGFSPYGGLIIDSFGSLYGVTQAGGSQNAGVVFRYKPGSTYTVLFNFGEGTGLTPSGPLTLDSSGNLYGTTSFGGTQEGGVLFFLDKP